MLVAPSFGRYFPINADKTKVPKAHVANTKAATILVVPLLTVSDVYIRITIEKRHAVSNDNRSMMRISKKSLLILISFFSGSNNFSTSDNLAYILQLVPLHLNRWIKS